MALPYRAVKNSGAAYSSSNPKRNKGGTVIHGGDINTTTGPLTQNKSLRDLAEDSTWSSGYGSKVVALTGTASATGVQTAKGSGTLAYQPTADDPQFIIRGYSTKINNITSSMLRIVGSDSQWRQADKKGRQKAYGAYTGEAYREGGWNPLGASGDRSNWSNFAMSDKVTDDTTAVGGIVTALNDTFKSTTNNGTNSSDNAICNPRSSSADSRGELTYMSGGKTPKQDSYKQKTG